MHTIYIRSVARLLFILLLVCSTSALTHHHIISFQEIKRKISQKSNQNLRGVLVAIDLDKTLVDVNEKDEAILIDLFAPEFIKFILDNGGDVLILTARSYKNDGDRWGIADVSAIDGGQSLKLVEQNWEKYFRSQAISYSEKYGITFRYESPPGYPEQINTSSLFSRGILFSRGDSETIPCKGLCLHKFIKLANLKHIHTVILIDDQEGYLDEFQFCFAKEKSTVVPINVETYHFVK